MHPLPALVLLLASALSAAEPDPFPAGTAPWGDQPLTRGSLATPAPGYGTLRVIPGDAQTPGGHREVLELTTQQAAPTPWSLQATIPSTGPIAKGDTVVVECWLRTAASSSEDGEARTSLQIERRGPPWSKVVTRDLSAPADGTWSRRTCAGIASEDYVTGAAQLNFHMGYGKPQTIQIAGLRVIDLGPGIDPLTLPVQRTTYPGMEPDAAWRAVAAARIERLRKGDLHVTVTDDAGRPVAGAQVHVAMQRHAFPFGSALAPNRLMADGADGDRYRAWVLANCSRVVFENHLKWKLWESGAAVDAPTWQRRDATLAAMTWLNEHGIALRGHCLMWPSWNCSPDRLRALANDSVALRVACDAHLADILAATAPFKLVEWDVVNENFGNHDLTDLLGPDEVVRWFKLARQAFPVGGLVYNDYAHLRPGDPRHAAFVESEVLRLKRAGAPLTVLGIQSHFNSSLIGPAAVLSELDRLSSKLDVDLAISEFDVAPTDHDEELQAAYTRDFLTACFSHPRVSEFITWGFWAGAHSWESAAMLRRDWTPKPAALAWDGLVRKAWWTDVTITTDATGSATVRSFKGSYRLTATAAGGSAVGETAIGDTTSDMHLHLSTPTPENTHP